MPYKDKEKERESARIRKQRQRSRPVDVTPFGKLLSRPNGEPYNPEELLPDGRKRYLGPFSDGQVLDRLSVSDPIVPNKVNISDRCSLPRHQFIQNLENCNRADSWRGNFSKESFIKLSNILGDSGH